ncbi:chymotrypsin inhibitor Ani s 6-like [Phlebotomus argentipes]|uniref:chymotrypsin inhibitor Ani s 6-like n=1 Tax=Phlebotomus argentipes TaxID=94469 RepID=UPI0028935660|nr:chymotrypsin inhibitor Ani s 6-like [Phlebotomus argentipes]
MISHTWITDSLKLSAMKTFAFVIFALIISAISANGEECTGANQVFVKCGPSCDSYCDGHDCGIRYFVCPDQCYCAPGYLRNNAEQCIPKQECP